MWNLSEKLSCTREFDLETDWISFLDNHTPNMFHVTLEYSHLFI